MNGPAPSAPISFLSDFGLTDEFVGVVHGVLAKLAPRSQVIDVTHGIRPGDVRAGALALTRAIQYLPEGVVLAVVDPGVGTARRGLAVDTDAGLFVGPDNGLLSPAVAMLGGARTMVSLENTEYRIPSPGATFHGRDVFAPAAAVLASGEAEISDLGPGVDPGSTVPLLLPLPEVQPHEVSGEAWWVDRFGNAQTNVGPDELGAIGISVGQVVEVTLGGTPHEIPWVQTYGDVGDGEVVLYVDGSGLMAIAVRGGHAAEALGLAEGASVTFRAT